MAENGVKIKATVYNPLTVEERVHEGIRTWKAEYLNDIKGGNGIRLESMPLREPRDYSINDSGQSKVES